MNPLCPRCGAGCSVKHGRSRRQEDAQFIQRYRCKACGKTHSSATHTATYRQKRRRLNRLIEADLASSTSERRIAIKLGCARKTVARKVVFLADQARARAARWIAERGRFEHVQFDELISFEHTRLKPLSIAVMSSVGDRVIVGIGVAQIPASGTIAQRSREKYGLRRDMSGSMRRSVLRTCAPHLSSRVQVDTDEHRRYHKEISQILPGASHKQYPSIRGSLTGLGELKRTGHDPLFTINHTLAMLRDNIKRLARRTWCTTKKRRSLENLLAIYIHYHNTTLIPDPAERDIRRIDA